ncbi:HAMP domain protein [Sphingomonas sp. S17]|jgi:two-component system sensor histidine kinase AdeS|uniref:histidine kinase n=4 Tax=Sphingomonas paucimobilis TaxID=13689 RepID=A0A411LJC7_SPHPI|nr:MULTISPECIES: ATP-binding protein [Sphingomonas]EGI56386.1 HAMP domain protein [Sphingomonas sp. S17]MBQ1479073.1 HAMP domain-containing histidine kinase [Sphingomonas sp.]MCM3678564.1 ATP-binding protein [Sphingomonas paucimobilis]MDG5969592.1 HAMP domain-containing protein [Sphingomonas paucimobilis]NNG59506.1 HAMP domain-containing histidine kinase [Sphingomonas paucimobilis]
MVAWMKNRISLTRQLSVAMAALAFVAVVVSTAAFYIVYAVLERLRLVAPLPPGVADTTGLDVGITLAACVIGVALALAVAVRLARWIVHPLGAVGAAARQIAEGDLTTRIAPVRGAHGEAAVLIADFNAMADRLQRMSDDVKLWNAQIAHELRTPLTILRGRLQGAKDGVFPLDDELVVGLVKQVEGLTRLVEDLRSVSLAESGRLELEMANVDLAAEMDDMRPILSSMLSPAGFELEMTLETGAVRADAARIRQAVIALVDNARRHASPCTLGIAVEFTKNEAVITVADKGPGLPPEFEKSAFRQFVRGTGNPGGSGLGLSVVQAIARAHGGDAIYQRVAKQSLFRILLPVKSD